MQDFLYWIFFTAISGGKNLNFNLIANYLRKKSSLVPKLKNFNAKSISTLEFLKAE